MSPIIGQEPMHDDSATVKNVLKRLLQLLSTAPREFLVSQIEAHVEHTLSGTLPCTMMLSAAAACACLCGSLCEACGANRSSGYCRLKPLLSKKELTIVTAAGALFRNLGLLISIAYAPQWDHNQGQALLYGTVAILSYSMQYRPFFESDGAAAAAAVAAPTAVPVAEPVEEAAEPAAARADARAAAENADADADADAEEETPELRVLVAAEESAAAAAPAEVKEGVAGMDVEGVEEEIDDGAAMEVDKVKMTKRAHTGHVIGGLELETDVRRGGKKKKKKKPDPHGVHPLGTFFGATEQIIRQPLGDTNANDGERNFAKLQLDAAHVRSDRGKLFTRAAVSGQVCDIMVQDEMSEAQQLARDKTEGVRAKLYDEHIRAGGDEAPRLPVTLKVSAAEAANPALVYFLLAKMPSTLLAHLREEEVIFEEADGEGGYVTIDGVEVRGYTMHIERVKDCKSVRQYQRHRPQHQVIDIERTKCLKAMVEDSGSRFHIPGHKDAAATLLWLRGRMVDCGGSTHVIGEKNFDAASFTER